MSATHSKKMLRSPRIVATVAAIFLAVSASPSRAAAKR